MKEEILGEHIIYGEWDDVIDNQFMVYFHPNGRDCVIFLFSGCDYGGGIYKVIETETGLFEKIYNDFKQSDDSGWVYVLKKKLGELG